MFHNRHKTAPPTNRQTELQPKLFRPDLGMEEAVWGIEYPDGLFLMTHVEGRDGVCLVLCRQGNLNAFLKLIEATDELDRPTVRTMAFATPSLTCVTEQLMRIEARGFRTCDGQEVCGVWFPVEGEFQSF